MKSTRLLPVFGDLFDSEIMLAGKSGRLAENDGREQALGRSGRPKH